MSDQLNSMNELALGAQGETSQIDQRAVDVSWMQQALALTAKADQLNEVPVGAIVVRDGEILGHGWNQPISACDPTAHAEIIALRDAAQQVGNYRLPGATLYVTIEPCTMCAGAIVHARVERVVYGATEPKSGAVESNGQVFEREQFNHRVITLGGVSEEEATAKIQAFFKRRRHEKKAEKLARREAEQLASGKGLPAE